MNLTITAMFIFFLSVAAFSNEKINSQQNKYYEFLALNGIIERPSLIYHSYSNNAWMTDSIKEEHPWGDNAKSDSSIYNSDSISFKIINPELFNSYNTKYPHVIKINAMLRKRINRGDGSETAYFVIKDNM